ncbi:LCP family protein [Isoptericola dokdonensis]|jgi:LCP family protein required for cell wall assembly|uniref:Transcriptional regulator LytR n=1 Tax=Isoptericola dokdonensis DS-3 TaxID=1300344 RepID=A0A168G003_9MICO|nr:LCP family protein [Isoptericola dokdonensis]ANC32819.1 Transcriptional regulator LytR [Isoptericola dokdonensis DS-3]
MSDERRIPPSFTPAGGRSSRPSSSGDAISVGGGTGSAPRPTGRVGRRDDAVPLDGHEPRVRRQSSREVPVSSADRSGGARQSSRQAAAASRPPRSYPPSQRPAGQPPAQRPAAQQPAGSRQGAPAQRPSSPPPPRNPGNGGTAAAAGRPGGFRVRKGRVAALVLVALLVLVLAWPIGLMVWANGKVQHVDALSGADGTPGTTYLLAGSDKRGSGGVDDDTSGARTDTIMVLHKPRSGPVALISIPRDTYAEIPGEGMNKINASYAWGGPPLLVESVEQLTGLTVDHYAEVGFGALEDLVNAVGGVELCYDETVKDKRSELNWKAGCHEADGATALAFSRMRYSDLQGDIGRAERQRQVIAAVSAEVVQPGVLLNPVKQVALVDAGTGALVVDEDTGIFNLGQLALAFRSATGPEGVTGTPPIADPGYNAGDGSGSTVLLADDADAFWVDVRDGDLEPGTTVGGLDG